MCFRMALSKLVLAVFFLDAWLRMMAPQMLHLACTLGSSLVYVVDDDVAVYVDVGCGGKGDQIQILVFLDIDIV